MNATTISLPSGHLSLVSHPDQVEQLVLNATKGFEYALREENRTLFNKMLSNKEEYADCMSAKGENFSTEVLFMILIFEQQKMINELITRLAEEKNVD